MSASEVIGDILNTAETLDWDTLQRAVDGHEGPAAAVEKARSVVDGIRFRLAELVPDAKEWLKMQQPKRISALPGEGSQMFSVSYKHRGEVVEGLRNGFGITIVEETDWNIVGGYLYDLRTEIGWHEPSRPLHDGAFHVDGYSIYDSSTQAIRTIDETGGQIGLWSSRLGGIMLSKKPRPIQDKQIFIGMVSPTYDGAVGARLTSRHIVPVNVDVSAPRQGFEHLFGTDIFSNRARVATDRGGFY